MRRYLLITLALILSFFALQNMSLGQTSDNPNLPVLGGDETELFTLADGVYFFDTEIIGTEGGIVPDNFSLIAFRYTLEPSQTQGTWQRVQLENQPPLRIGAAITEVNDKVYFFGGLSKNSATGEFVAFGDMYVFETTHAPGEAPRGKFTEIEDTSDSAPGNRFGSIAISSGKSLWIVNGTLPDNSATNEVHKYNIDNNTWIQTQQSTDGVQKPLDNFDTEAERIAWIETSGTTLFEENFNESTLVNWQKNENSTFFAGEDFVKVITEASSLNRELLSNVISVEPNTNLALDLTYQAQKGNLQVVITDATQATQVASFNLANAPAPMQNQKLVFNTLNNSQIHIAIFNNRPDFGVDQNADGISEYIFDELKLTGAENFYMLGKKQDQSAFSFWKFDFSDPSDPWQEIVDQTLPAYRESYGYTQDETTGALYMFGGLTEQIENEDTEDEIILATYFGDFYRFSNGTVSEIPVEGELTPSERSSPKLTFYNNELFVMGGENDETFEDLTSEIWSFERNTNTWTDRSFTREEETDPSQPGPGDIDIPDPDGIFRGDVLVTDKTRAIKIITSVPGKKVRCSATKKKRSKIIGNNTQYFEFQYGRGMTLEPEPISTFSQDNNLNFIAKFDAGEGRNMQMVVWQVEEVKDFEGFDREFFETFINPLETTTIRSANAQPGNPDFSFNFDNVNPALPLSENGQITTYQKQEVTVAFGRDFAPGRYRVHVMGIANNDPLTEQISQYNYLKDVRIRVCGKTRSVPPSRAGISDPGEKHIPFYYISHFYEFEIPEIQNYTDTVSIDETKPFLEEGYINTHPGIPPNLVNSMRPIFYGKTDPESEIIPLIGRVDRKVKSLKVLLSPLNDNPFGETESIYQGTSQRLRISADKTGQFSFQPLNTLPYNSNDLVKYYYLHTLSIDKHQNIVGAPPVKVAITEERLPPRIFNYNSGDETNVPRPVFLGAFMPNRNVIVKYKDEEFVVRAGYDGNFRFNLPINLEAGENEIILADENEPEYERSLIINYDETLDDIAPQLVSVISNNHVFTNLPVFNGTYKPNSSLSFIFDEGKVSEDSGVVETDENGQFIIQKIDFMKGTVSDEQGGGLHSLRVFDQEKQVRVDFRISEKHFPLPENLEYSLPDKDAIATLMDGGQIAVDNKSRLFLHTRDKIRVMENMRMNIPQGSIIKHANNGFQETVTRGGVFELLVDDVVIMPILGGVVWVEETERKALVVPMYTSISAFEPGATFFYFESGEIATIDTIIIRSASQELEVSQMDIETYYTLPFTRPARVFNYQSGDIITHTNPEFLGSTLPNSPVEIWVKKPRENDSINDFEHIVATTIADSFGRFRVKISEELEPDTEYEFAFVNRAEQSPAIRINLQTAETLSEGQQQLPFQVHQSVFRSGRDAPQLQKTLHKQLPTQWNSN